MPFAARCATGKCAFRTPDGKASDDLPPPRRKKGAPAETALEDLPPSKLVYDVQEDPANKCKGTCRCFIVIQRINKAGKVVSEIYRSADGDDKNGLDKKEVDKFKKNVEKGESVKFLAACLETQKGDDGQLEPKPDK
jgi:hypothetical protein